MQDLSFSSIAAVAAIALVAPLLVSLAPRLRVPAVVLEILLGVLVGPAVLGWVAVGLPLEVLSLIGLSFLLFLGGLELDLSSVRAQGPRIALAYGCSAVLALGAGCAAPDFRANATGSAYWMAGICAPATDARATAMNHSAKRLPT